MMRNSWRLRDAWVAAMSSMALLSFGILDIDHGALSPVHILSTITLTRAPMLAWHAHRIRVEAHRATALSLISGALLVAGAFTFQFGRWLLG